MELRLAQFTEPSADVMRWLVLFTAYFLLLLFVIGLFDILLGLFDLIKSGEFTNPVEVIDLLNTVLLLLIIVEVHRTLIAYVREEPVIRIVIGAAIIAIAREVITFQVSNFEAAGDALTGAGALALLLVALMIAYFAVWQIDPALGSG